MTVSRVLRKKKIAVRPQAFYVSKLTDEQTQQIVERYKEGESSKSLAREYDVAVTTILDHIKKSGQNPRGNPPKRLTNERAFTYPSGENEYWLGMLLTDRCLIESFPGMEPSFVLCLEQSDKEQLENFRTFLHAPGRIWAKVGPVRLRVVSRSLVDRLWELGIVQDGPRLCRLPEFANQHLWRGVIDAVGEVKEGMISITANDKLLSQFWMFVSEIHPGARGSFGDGRMSIKGQLALDVTSLLYDSVSADRIIPHNRWLKNRTWKGSDS